jgi:hypothetical protein
VARPYPAVTCHVGVNGRRAPAQRGQPVAASRHDCLLKGDWGSNRFHCSSLSQNRFHRTPPPVVASSYGQLETCIPLHLDQRACAASGHAAAAPPSAASNSCRPMVTVIRPSRARRVKASAQRWGLRASIFKKEEALVDRDRKLSRIHCAGQRIGVARWRTERCGVPTALAGSTASA